MKSFLAAESFAPAARRAVVTASLNLFRHSCAATVPAKLSSTAAHAVVRALAATAPAAAAAAAAAAAGASSLRMFLLILLHVAVRPFQVVRAWAWLVLRASAGELSSATKYDYCLAVGFALQTRSRFYWPRRKQPHPVKHVVAEKEGTPEEIPVSRVEECVLCYVRRCSSRNRRHLTLYPVGVYGAPSPPRRPRTGGRKKHHRQQNVPAAGLGERLVLGTEGFPESQVAAFLLDATRIEPPPPPTPPIAVPADVAVKVRDIKREIIVR